MTVEAIIRDYISVEDLSTFEEKYNSEKKSGKLSLSTQFEYGWCLVRSRYREDIRNGIHILDELCSSKTDQRDFLFFISIGYYKLAEYNKAMKYVKRLLAIEPKNLQALDLERLIHTNLRSEGLLGMAMIGGAAVIAGCAVLAGFALSKK